RDACRGCVLICCCRKRKLRQKSLEAYEKTVPEPDRVRHESISIRKSSLNPDRSVQDTSSIRNFSQKRDRIGCESISLPIPHKKPDRNGNCHVLSGRQTPKLEIILSKCFSNIRHDLFFTGNDAFQQCCIFIQFHVECFFDYAGF